MASEWEQPLLSVDVVAVRWHDGHLQYALHDRPNEPFAGRSALPGVLLLAGESLEDAARRAIETKLAAPTHSIRSIRQIAAFDGTNRDPRGATISIAHFAFLDDESSETGAQWREASDVPALPFDHNVIVSEAFAMAARLIWTDPAFTRMILVDGFSTNDLLSLSRQLGAELPGAQPAMGRWIEAHFADRDGYRGRSAVWRWRSR